MSLINRTIKSRRDQKAQENSEILAGTRKDQNENRAVRWSEIAEVFKSLREVWASADAQDLSLFGGTLSSNNYEEDADGQPIEGWQLNGPEGTFKGKSVITQNILAPGSVSFQRSFYLNVSDTLSYDENARYPEDALGDLYAIPVDFNAIINEYIGAGANIVSNPVTIDFSLRFAAANPPEAVEIYPILVMQDPAHPGDEAYYFHTLYDHSSFPTYCRLPITDALGTYIQQAFTRFTMAKEAFYKRPFGGVRDTGYGEINLSDAVAIYWRIKRPGTDLEPAIGNTVADQVTIYDQWVAISQINR